MITRRSLLASLSALPFLGWIKPKETPCLNLPFWAEPIKPAPSRLRVRFNGNTWNIHNQTGHILAISEGSRNGVAGLTYCTVIDERHIDRAITLVPGRQSVMPSMFGGQFPAWKDWREVRI